MHTIVFTTSNLKNQARKPATRERVVYPCKWNYRSFTRLGYMLCGVLDWNHIYGTIREVESHTEPHIFTSSHVFTTPPNESPLVYNSNIYAPSAYMNRTVMTK